MSSIEDRLVITRLNAKVEALEGEIARLNAECCRCGQPTTAVCKAARDAEARAERLRVALLAIAVKAGTFDGMGSYTAYVMMAGQIEQMADAAIHAAAGGEG